MLALSPSLPWDLGPRPIHLRDNLPIVHALLLVDALRLDRQSGVEVGSLGHLDAVAPVVGRLVNVVDKALDKLALIAAGDGAIEEIGLLADAVGDGAAEEIELLVDADVDDEARRNS